MQWSEDMSVGIAEIDDQHKTLLDYLVLVERATGEGHAGTEVYFALDQFATYVRIHFAVEEIEMRIHRYPGLDAHIMLHRDFEARLRMLEGEALTRNVYAKVRDLLRGWLVQHIKTEDIKYAPYLLGTNSGAVK